MQQSPLSYMFHNFEKQLRRLLQREFHYDIERQKISETHWYKDAWKLDFSMILNKFETDTWVFSKSINFDKINACRLIVNIFKHGNGKSLLELTQKYPIYLNGGTDSESHISETALSDDYIRHYDQIGVNKLQFQEISNAILDFWKELPENIFFK